MTLDLTGLVEAPLGLDQVRATGVAALITATAGDGS